MNADEIHKASNPTGAWIPIEERQGQIAAIGRFFNEMNEFTDEHFLLCVRETMFDCFRDNFKQFSDEQIKGFYEFWGAMIP